MARPRGPMTEEQKEAMRASRARAREARLMRVTITEPANPDRAFIGEPGNVEDEPERLDPDIQALIDDGLITLADVEQARIDAKAKIIAERKATARKALNAKMLEKERLEAGLTPQIEQRRQQLDQLMDIQITLPFLRSPNSNVINYPDPIRIDHRQFGHGRNYRVTRAVAETLVSMMGLARKHAAQVGGESPAYYDANRGAFSYMGGPAAGTGGAGLTSPTMQRRGTAA